MRPCGFEPAGKYQSAVTVQAALLHGSCSVEVSTVTVLPGGSPGGPSMSRIAVLNIVFTAVSTTSNTFASVRGELSEVCWTPAGFIATDCARTAGSNSRRANASRAHAAGLSVDSLGPLDAANG